MILTYPLEANKEQLLGKFQVFCTTIPEIRGLKVPKNNQQCVFFPNFLQYNGRDSYTLSLNLIICMYSGAS